MAACTSGVEKIEYGKESCHYCKMIIVDKRFGAQAITEKYKTYKFDAIECVLNFLKKEKESIKKVWVTDYHAPPTFIDASQSIFLKSSSIPSPMGEFLSAFKDKNIASSLKKDQKDQLFSWEELKKYSLQLE